MSVLRIAIFLSLEDSLTFSISKSRSNSLHDAVLSVKVLFLVSVSSITHNVKFVIQLVVKLRLRNFPHSFFVKDVYYRLIVFSGNSVVIISMVSQLFDVEEAV